MTVHIARKNRFNFKTAKTIIMKRIWYWSINLYLYIHTYTDTHHTYPHTPPPPPTYLPTYIHTYIHTIEHLFPAISSRSHSGCDEAIQKKNKKQNKQKTRTPYITTKINEKKKKQYEQMQPSFCVKVRFQTFLETLKWRKIYYVIISLQILSLGTEKLHLECLFKPSWKFQLDCAIQYLCYVFHINAFISSIFFL